MRFFFAPICVHIGERSVLYISIRSLLFPLFDAFPFSCLIETWGFRLTSVYGPSVFSLFFCPSLYKTQLWKEEEAFGPLFLPRVAHSDTHRRGHLSQVREREIQSLYKQIKANETKMLFQSSPQTFGRKIFPTIGVLLFLRSIIR